MHNKCNSGRFGMQKSTNDMSSVLVELAVIFIWSLWVFTQSLELWAQLAKGVQGEWSGISTDNVKR